MRTELLEGPSPGNVTATIGQWAWCGEDSGQLCPSLEGQDSFCLPPFPALLTPHSPEVAAGLQAARHPNEPRKYSHFSRTPVPQDGGIGNLAETHSEMNILLLIIMGF